MISGETIDSYFTQLDWPFQREDEHTWTTGYKGETYAFPVYVRIDAFWLYVYAALPVQVHPSVRTSFYRHLLQLNHEVNLAKFTMDDDDQIGLIAELPNSDLSLSAFESALRVVCLYLDANYVDLVNRAVVPAAPTA